MDFGSVLSLASKNLKKQRPLEKRFNSDLEAPKKNKKEKDGRPKSETLQKYLQEKEQERKERELQEERKREEERKHQIEEEKKKIFRIPKKPRPTEENEDKISKLTEQAKLEKARKLAASFGKNVSSSGNRESKEKKSADVKSDKKNSKNCEKSSDYQKTVGDKPNLLGKEPSRQTGKKPSYLDKLDRISDEGKLAIIKKISESLGRKGDKISDAEKLDKIKKISETIGKKSSDIVKTDKANGSVKSCPLSGKVDRDKLAGSIESLQKMKKDLKEAEEKVLGKTITMLGKTDEGIKREVKHFDRSDAERMRHTLQEKAARIKAMMNQPDEEPKPRERKKRKESFSESGDKAKKSDSSRSDDTHVSEKRKSLSSDYKKSSSHSNDSKNRDKYSDDRTSEKYSKEEKIKKKPPPPSMNFNDLLKIAEKKSQEPIKIEPKKPVKEEERPMTKKELALQKEFQEFLKYKQQQKEAEKEYRENSEVKTEKINSNHNRSKSTSNLVSKSTNSSQSALKKNPYTEKSISSSRSSSPVPGPSKMNSNKIVKKSVSSSSILSKPLTKNFKLSSKSGERDSDLQVKKSKNDHSSNQRVSSSSKTDDIRKKSSGAKSNNYDNVGENVLVCGPTKSDKPVASNPFDRIYGEIKKNQPSRPVKRKHPLDSESEDELDEDLEGFVVDYLSSGEEEEMDDYDNDYDDYSKHIRNIFGYDKRKFKYESDYDIANMEANFKDVMKEEARSARLGLQEDLEDMRKEEEEKKRKKMKR